MRTGARRTLGTILVCAAGSVACDSGDPGTECTCADPTITITVPADRAPYVVDTQLSGEGCTTAALVCRQPVGSGCAQMAFRATATGSCTVDVTLSDGPADFQTTFPVVRYRCCPGYYAELASGSTIDVPDLPGDAGASE